MLESAVLHIGPWVDDGSGIARRISDGGSGAPLGVVRRLASARWLPWPRPGALHVLETEDEALVFSMQGPLWLGTWQFHDAEERYLGRLTRHRRLLDATGEQVAQQHREGPRARFLSPAGHELASHQPVSAGAWELNFSPERTTSPFTRMLLLGGVIADLEGGS